MPIDLDDPPPPLFTPFKLREMVLANRVVVSAMCQYSAEDGSPTDWHFVHLGSRAVGGAGLVFSEMTDISREARISPGCAGMYRPEHVAAWKRIVDFVHDNTEAKIGLQLGHAGRKGSTRLAWEGMDEPLESGNWEIVGPSPIPYFPHSQVPREMDRDDMDAIRDDFVRAAKMAEEARFDIIELHFAHGYLLASFVSPLTNQRRDEYGGSLENRLRFPLEVVARAQTDLGPDLGGRLGTRRDRGNRRGRDRADAQGSRLRHRRRFSGSDTARRQANLRPSVSNPVQRPDSSRGRNPDDGGRQHLVVHGREHDPGRRSGRSVCTRPGSPVGSVLDTERGAEAGILVAVAQALFGARRLSTAFRVIAVVR